MSNDEAVQGVMRWTRVGQLLQGLKSAVDDAPEGSRIRTLADSVIALQAEIGFAEKAKDVGARERVEVAANELWTLVEDWRGVRRVPWYRRLLEQFSVPAMVGVAALLFTFGGLAWLLAEYLNKSGWLSLQTVQGTRPVLVLAAVVATLTYGGGLLFSALFSNEGTFAERFRMAREIFLVFSGVFATVVGFHFGQASDTVAVEPLVVSAEAGLRPGILVASVRGGKGPYAAVLGGDVEPQKPVSGSGPRLELPVVLKAGKGVEKFDELSVTVTDEGKRSAKVELKKSDLDKLGFSFAPPAGGSPTPTESAGAASKSGSAPGGK